MLGNARGLPSTRPTVCALTCRCKDTYLVWLAYTLRESECVNKARCGFLHIEHSLLQPACLLSLSLYSRSVHDSLQFGSAVLVAHRFKDIGIGLEKVEESLWSWKRESGINLVEEMENVEM